MKQPYLKIEHNIKTIVLELTKKAKELNMDNISFEASINYDPINFYINQYKTRWEMVVKHAKYLDSKRHYYTDMYTITENELIYTESEEDVE